MIEKIILPCNKTNNKKKINKHKYNLKMKFSLNNLKLIKQIIGVLKNNM